MQQNRIQVAKAEFKSAMKPFTAKRRKLDTVLLAFEGGYLSIESGEVRAVMHAEGEWNGRATFSPEFMRALALVPPAQDPIAISYAQGHLLIGTMTIPCHWDTPMRAVIQDLANPGLVDLLALERTIARSEYVGTDLGRKLRNAKERSERRIRNAAAQLQDLEISERQIRDLVEARIAERMASPG